MNVRPAFLALAVISFAGVSPIALSQSSLQNPGFETGSPGQPPPGWFVPQPVLDAGYSAHLSSDSPKDGKQCAVITLSGAPGRGFGNIMQAIDAKAYRGKRVLFRAAVRFEKGSGFGQAQLWMRVDRAGGTQGFFNNMGDRPITSATWAYYDIAGDIDADADFINVGMLMAGSGQAWIDGASLGLDDGKPKVDDGPRALSERGRDNLIAFTKLYGYVRHFHPSDAVEKADWNYVALAGVRVAEGAKDPAELAQVLESYFRPYAPTVRVFVTGKKPALPKELRPPADTTGLQVVTWKNIGFGGGFASQKPYSSKRVFVEASAGKVPTGTVAPDAPFEADLGGGVSCTVPLSLFAKADSALPASADLKVSGDSTPISGNDRTTRIADIAIAWNVFEHFYPYFDVVKVDWPAMLSQTLELAATDLDETAFAKTLLLLVASAQDGHGYAGLDTNMARALPNLLVDWVEGKLVILQVGAGIPKLQPGDEILKIDGKPVSEVWKKSVPYLCGATDQWRRYLSTMLLMVGLPGSTVTLETMRGTGTPEASTLERKMEQLPVETRPKAIEELKPGIWYVDICTERAKMEDYTKAIPDLAKAKGIIFDLRGYPNNVAMDVVHRISEKPVMSAFWKIPLVDKPDHKWTEYVTSRWDAQGPLEPRFTAKIAFMTDGGAISYAESIMGIVEAYKLGEIVGATTAGTNGNVNPFKLPGGYTVVFTGMQVIKHDGSTHHGIGVKPTVPVHRTIAGVAAKRDEVLEKAISVVGG